MEDRVDVQSVWEVKFVGHWGNLQGDVVGTNESMLKFLGGTGCLGGKVDVIGREQYLVSYHIRYFTARLVSILFLVGFGQNEGVCGDLGGIFERF